VARTLLSLPAFFVGVKRFIGESISLRFKFGFLKFLKVEFLSHLQSCKMANGLLKEVETIGAQGTVH